MDKRKAEIKRIKEAYCSTLRGLTLPEVKSILGLEHIADEEVEAFSFAAEYKEINEHILGRFYATDERLRKWQKQQVKRMRDEGCHRYINIPLAFELSDGCSRNCAFCGLSANPLRGVYLATDEHIEEFNAVLDFLVPIIGDGACDPILYYASEPLDNPDFFIFAELVRARSGHYPQVSTTHYIRKMRGIKGFLENVNNDKNMIHRFSVLSEEDLFSIYDYYSPEELYYVMLEARYRPQELFNCGKATGEITEPIACCSGFVFNFSSRSLRLETPTMPTKEHPNGVVKCYETRWNDVNELKYKVESILEHIAD